MASVLNFRKSATGAVVELRPYPGGDEPPDSAAYRLRVRQQKILTELGVLALKGTHFPELLDHAVKATAEGLQAEFCQVLKYKPSTNRLHVRAGVGWEPGVIGSATVGADRESPRRLRVADRSARHLQPSGK